MTNTITENIYASIIHQVEKKKIQEMKKPRLYLIRL